MFHLLFYLKQTAELDLLFAIRLSTTISLRRAHTPGKAQQTLSIWSSCIKFPTLVCNWFISTIFFEKSRKNTLSHNVEERDTNFLDLHPDPGFAPQLIELFPDQNLIPST